MANAHQDAPSDLSQADVQGFGERLVEFRASLNQTQGALMDGLMLQSEEYALDEAPPGVEVEGHALSTYLSIALKCGAYSTCFYSCWYRYGSRYIEWCGHSCATRYPCWATRAAGL